MSLFVLISGFGEPHWDNKVRILENNLEKLSAYKWEDIKVYVCQYSLSKRIPEELLNKYPFVKIIYQEGIVGHFIKKFANPLHIGNPTYVMLLLDDIELLNIDFKTIIRYQKEHSLDIISPCLCNESKYQYEYIRTSPNAVSIKIATCCEYFCMFFPFEKYKIYYSHIHEDNPWMWGNDLIIDKYMNLKIGLLNKMLMKHWYKSESYDTDLCKNYNPMKGLTTFIEQYKETYPSLLSQRAIKYYIIDTTK